MHHKKRVCILSVSGPLDKAYIHYFQKLGYASLEKATRQTALYS